MTLFIRTITLENGHVINRISRLQSVNYNEQIGIDYTYLSDDNEYITSKIVDAHEEIRCGL